MKDRIPVWFNILQRDFASRELDPKFVEAEVAQINQRWHDSRRLDAKMHGERFEADGCFYLREVLRSVVPYHLCFALTPSAPNIAAMEQQRSQGRRGSPRYVEPAEPWDEPRRNG